MRVNNKALRVYTLLLGQYGQHQWRPHHDTLSELILTILSQNTADTNSHRAFQQLIKTFPSWEAVLRADEAALAQSIKVSGLANIKARRIQGCLHQLWTRSGELSLRFLQDMDAKQAQEWLRSMKGVGPKTAACVLLFSLGRPVMPVDTHIHRISKRLGLVGDRASPEQTQAALEQTLPAEAIYSFHLNTIAHGRLICTAQRPKCPICILKPECDSQQPSPDKYPT
ncbi:MAG: endonuclease III [Chloroflexi bacterium]|nr:endonuclease III [Chloroflexota bacterium]MCL5074939.1 endonuclease III [Chloroflexota bacterium]